MAYVSTMILHSLRLLGEKERGGTLDTFEQADLLADFNSFLDGCSIERLLCYQVLQESFSLASGTVSYTIGSGATMSTTRPTKIVDPCFVRDSSNLDSPLKLLDASAYGRIVQKSGSGTTYPDYLFYDGAFDSSGFGTIYIYPPPASALTLFINSWKQLGSVSTISSQLSLPPGYQRFIEYNFAVEEAGGFTSVSPEVAMIARQSKAAIKSINAPDSFMRLEAGISQPIGSNILTGP